MRDDSARSAHEVEVQNAVGEFLTDEFESERRAGFRTVRRIPDTRVFRFLDYFADLAGAEQSELRDALVRRALLLLQPTGTAQDLSENSVAYRQYVDALRGMNADKYIPARRLESLAAYFHAGTYRAAFRGVPAGSLRYAASLNPTKTVELRRRINAAFAELFAANTDRLGANVWLYRGHLAGSRINVEIDYGGGSDQLRYQATVRSLSHPVVLKGLNYERVLGIGNGNWDFITEENLERSLSLLCEFVSYVAGLPGRLPDSCHRTWI